MVNGHGGADKVRSGCDFVCDFVMSARRNNKARSLESKETNVLRLLPSCYHSLLYCCLHFLSTIKIPTLLRFAGARSLRSPSPFAIIWQGHGAQGINGWRISRPHSQVSRGNFTMAATESDPETHQHKQQPMLARHRQQQQDSTSTDGAPAAPKPGFFPLGYKEGWSQWVSQLLDLRDVE